MVDLSAIKNKKLQEVLANSRRFELMSDKEQKATVDRAQILPKKELAEFVEFMKQENIQEEKKYKKPASEQGKLLAEFLEELGALTSRFEKLALQDKEKVDRTKEERKKDDLLDQLNNL